VTSAEHPSEPPAALDRRRLAFGSMAIGVVNVTKVGLQILMLPLMARLLGPADFGLYAMALPTIGLLLVLTDAGLANSMAREPNSNRPAWSSAFWVMQGLGLVMAALAVGLSFVIAEVAQQPRLPPLMTLLSLSFIITVWGVLPTARLMRDARLEWAACSDLASTLLGAAIAITLALKGFGAWSLAAQFVVVVASRALVLNLAAPVLPEFKFDWAALRGHLGFGGAVVGSKLSGFLGPLAENAMVGRWLGAAALGSYSLSNQVPRFLYDAVGNPLWANMYVQALRQTPEETAEAFYRLLRVYSLMVIPASALGGAAMIPIVDLFLGPQWQGTGVLLTILLPGMAIGAVGGLGGALMLAAGRGWLNLALSALIMAARLAAVALIPLFGLVGAAFGLAAVAVFGLAASIWGSARAYPIDPIKVVRMLAPTIAASAIAALACWGALQLRAPGLGWIIVCELGGFALLLGLLVVFDRRGLAEDIASVRSLLKPGDPSVAAVDPA
jgi:O-antigen/teichoic acid export membrane protein